MFAERIVSNDELRIVFSAIRLWNDCGNELSGYNVRCEHPFEPGIAGRVISCNDAVNTLAK